MCFQVRAHWLSCHRDHCKLAKALGNPSAHLMAVPVAPPPPPPTHFLQPPLVWQMWIKVTSMDASSFTGKLHNIAPVAKHLMPRHQQLSIQGSIAFIAHSTNLNRSLRVLQWHLAERGNRSLMSLFWSMWSIPLLLMSLLPTLCPSYTTCDTSSQRPS